MLRDPKGQSLERFSNREAYDTRVQDHWSCEPTKIPCDFGDAVQNYCVHIYLIWRSETGVGTVTSYLCVSNLNDSFAESIGQKAHVSGR